MKKLEIIALTTVILTFIFLVLAIFTEKIFFAWITVIIGIVGLMILIGSGNKEKENRDEDE